MKRFALAIGLIFASAICAHAKTPPNPADYTIVVHVSASHSVWNHGNQDLILDCTIDGKKYQLTGGPLRASRAKVGVLLPGNYPARITQANNDKIYLNIQRYELLLPDSKVTTFSVSGVSE